MDEHHILAAEALTQSEIDAGIRRAQQSLPKLPENWDGLCVKCDEPVPQARINFGASTCLRCQTLLEQKHSRTRWP